MTRKNIFSCLFFLAVWIFPIIYTGLTNRDVPGMPRTLAYIQRIAFLFTRGIPYWPVYYIQAIPEGAEEWITLPEEDYFKLKPFGYRTRLHQMLINSDYGIGFAKGRQRAKEREEEVMKWIAKKYDESHPDGPKLNALRLIRALYPTDQKPKERGHWQKPALDSFPAERLEILSAYSVPKAKP